MPLRRRIGTHFHQGASDLTGSFLFESMAQSTARCYLLNGTLMVWILDWTKKQIWVCTPDDEYVLNEADTLDGGNVLPGFKMSIADIFADPMTD
jgi:hypothetical protein